MHPFFSSGDHLLRMYDNFVRFIETDVNQLDLVVFGVAASQQQPNAVDALAFLDTLLAKVVAAKDTEAALLCRIEMAPLRLRAGDAKACQARGQMRQ